MDASLELQGKVVAVLKAAGVAGGRIYDSVPPEDQRKADTGAAFPYVSLGPWVSQSDDADCIDADEVTAQLDVWSRKPGSVEAKEVGKAVRVALKAADLTLSTNALVTFEHRITRVSRESDGLTTRAILTFTALVEEP